MNDRGWLLKHADFQPVSSFRTPSPQFAVAWPEVKHGHSGVKAPLRGGRIGLRPKQRLQEVVSRLRPPRGTVRREKCSAFLLGAGAKKRCRQRAADFRTG